MRCTNGQVFSDVVSFTVTVGEHPCNSVLSDVSGADDLSFPFKFEQPLESFTPTSSFVDWDTFFSNTDTTNCPITSCIVKWNACSEGSGRFSVDLAGLNGVTVDMYLDEGYVHTYCVECTNEIQTATLSGW